jgi:hypothetical protein
MKVTLAELGPIWPEKFGACLLMRLPGVGDVVALVTNSKSPSVSKSLPVLSQERHFKIHILQSHDTSDRYLP